MHIRFRNARGALRDFRRVVRAVGGEDAAQMVELQLIRMRPDIKVEVSATTEILQG